MMQTIIGLILLLSPFLLIFYKGKDKKLSFAYILSFLLAFHLLVALITQALHIFTYSVVITIHTIIFLAVLIKMNFSKSHAFLKDTSAYRNIRDKFFLGLKQVAAKIDWVLILVLIIAFSYLFSVHFNYSGKYSVITTPQYQEAENARYPYPYFSDEWYTVALIKDSIESQSLPFKNPLSRTGSAFINLEFAFHSFLAELVLLLSLNPLTEYTILTVFSGLLICLLIYLFLRQSNIAKLPAAITSLFALYITNGANLPGLWTLIPLTIGIISALLGFLFMASNKKKAALLISPVVLLFYPPLFIFYTLAIILFFISAKELSGKVKIKNTLFYFILLALVGIILASACFLTQKPINNFFPYIFSKIVYPTFTGDFNPQFSIFNIIPISVLFLFAFGLLVVIKRKIWLASALFLGLIYWALYSFTTLRVIIEYPRVVVFTSILIIITAGFGLNHLINVLKKLNFFEKNNALNYIQIAILICFLVFLPGYTKRDNWQNLKAYNPEIGQSFIPAAPANRYLHPDDLKLFEDINNQTFLSFPWKGTVIGVATNNYPLSTKEGTISINPNLFYRFMDSDCSKKYKIAKSGSIDFVYAPEFNCPNFEFIGESSEGLFLYKLVNSE